MQNVKQSDRAVLSVLLGEVLLIYGIVMHD